MKFILNKAQTISIFQVLSYVYTSEPRSDEIPDDLKEADHGVSIQFISSFVLSDDLFILITPIFDFKDLQDERKDEFILMNKTCIAPLALALFNVEQESNNKDVPTQK